jgi:hypothetical protein
MFRSAAYDALMRRRITGPRLLLALFAASALFLTAANAQINGAPASVTSPGFGGRAVNGPPSSVTSLGPRGYSGNGPVTFSTTPSAPHVRNGDGQHHRRQGQGQYYGPVLYAYPYGYAYPYDDQGGPPQDYAAPEDNEANYQGGPTIFDRRGSGEHSYIPPVNNIPASQTPDTTGAPESVPAPPPDPTVLVFKDGHKMEVANYAIVGATLFDLTPGRPRRIALAELDLPATQKQNDDRGVNFQLPPSARVN